MSVSFGCHINHVNTPLGDCPERKKPMAERAWRIMQYRHNHSAFNGRHFTPSDWSSIICDACGACGRSKAKWVDDLYDEKGAAR